MQTQPCHLQNILPSSKFLIMRFIYFLLNIFSTRNYSTVPPTKHPSSRKIFPKYKRIFGQRNTHQPCHLQNNQAMLLQGFTSKNISSLGGHCIGPLNMMSHAWDEASNFNGEIFCLYHIWLILWDLECRYLSLNNTRAEQIRDLIIK